ncbi:CinA family nicotinamide mononucleotide deamidase-related protein [Gimesia chilikensis]|uniref:CinA family nicotinamide mononucleotide deamidase-related protein n=1 Tax=Gimesia chilikensis TaxID=2605989 RepID=UPI0011EFC281|nr:CinA family nicotinamide mononucleotide deamidase-related protein [Gimesia chilikensis]KAA0140705.1 CinA family nicotinamide mononucleotide deamidase-related protein [Gimesia chilikensis]
MQAEIIAIGSELTNGEKLDTNSQWLSTELAAAGIATHFHTTIADNLDEIIDQLRLSASRSDLILITGGLGPTLDDLTRQAMAGLTGTDLVLDAESLAIIESMFQKRYREMPERNRIQAMFPEGAEPIKNEHGTAPGIWMMVPRDGGEGICHIAAMPGVPSEMKPMFYESVLPRLVRGTRIIRFARINCFGVGESKTEELLGDITSRGRDPEVGITAHEATITLRIKAMGESNDDCEQKISATYEQIRERLGDYIFGYEDEELEHVVVTLLNESKLSVAASECGTGGLLSYRLTEVAGSADCFKGGAVLARVDTFSADGALALAKSTRETQTSDYGLAILLDLNQSWQDRENAPQAFVALASDDGAWVEEIGLTVNRAIAKSRISKAALDLLRRKLLKIER